MGKLEIVIIVFTFCFQIHIADDVVYQPHHLTEVSQHENDEMSNNLTESQPRRKSVLDDIVANASESTLCYLRPIEFNPE
jgi:hypothetical protein